MTILPKSIHRDEPLHLLLDSTGLTMYGESEWLDQPRVAFVPLGVGANCISASMPARMKSSPSNQDDVGDVSEIVALLDQVASPVASVIADGAYDGETVYDTVTDRHPEADIVIPPRATAVPSTSGATQRNQHIAAIEQHGRIGWQRRSGCNRRSLVETAMYRYKTINGRRLLARSLSSQQVEAKVGCNVLNRITSFGMPATIRIG